MGSPVHRVDGAAALERAVQSGLLILPPGHGLVPQTAYVPSHSDLDGIEVHREDVGRHDEIAEPLDTRRNGFSGAVAVSNAQRVEPGLKVSEPYEQPPGLLVEPEQIAVACSIESSGLLVGIVEADPSVGYVYPLVQPGPELEPVPFGGIPRTQVLAEDDLISSVHEVSSAPAVGIPLVLADGCDVILDSVLPPCPACPAVYLVLCREDQVLHEVVCRVADIAELE